MKMISHEIPLGRRHSDGRSQRNQKLRHGPGEVPSDQIWSVLLAGAPGGTQDFVPKEFDVWRVFLKSKSYGPSLHEEVLEIFLSKF